MKRPGNWIVFVAQGFGSGWARRGPGTAGSAVGLIWTWVLLATGSLWVFWIANLAALGAAVWLCGEAERFMGEHDPGSIVLDEIVAVPLCFGTLLTTQAWNSSFQGASAWMLSLPWWVIPAVFVGFRFFDIAKPWPVRQVQALRGGWGIVADDVVAAMWVNLACWVATGWKPACCG